MLRSKLTVVLACAALIACTQELTNRERLLESERLESRLAAWVSHMNNAKLDSLVGMYDSSATVAIVGLDGRSSRGMEQVRAALEGFFGKIAYMNFVMQDPRIDVLSKNVAVSVFRHSTDIVQANRQRIPVQSGPGSMVWVMDADARVWKIHLQHFAVSAPSGN